MNMKLVRCVATLSAAAGLALSAQAADWLYSGTALTEQGADVPWVLKVSLKKGTTELSVESVTTDGGNAELDFSGAIRGEDGTAYTVVSLTGFTKKSITKVVLPAGLRRLGTTAFNGCTALRTVTPLLPETLTEIGLWAFGGCTALEGDVVFPAQAVVSPDVWQNLDYARKGWFQGSKITSCDMSQATMTWVATASFRNCSALKWVKLPKGLKTVGSDAFVGCTALETVEPLLPDTVTSFGTCPFMNCVSLTGDVKLTNSSATVTFSHHGNNSYGAFQGCKLLASFEMTASIAHNQSGDGFIDSCLLKGCSSLGRVVLPANVRGTMSSVFHGCSSLTNVTFLGWQAPTSFNKNTFSGSPNHKVRLFFPRLSPTWEAFVPTLTSYTPMNESLQKLYLEKYPGATVLPLGRFYSDGSYVWVSDLEREDANSVYVLGSPVEADAADAPVAPSYGGHHDLVNGETREFSAPDVAVFQEGEYVCAGYELSYETDTRVWSEPETGTGTRCTIAQSDDKSWRLTWLWTPRGYALGSTPVNGGGSVACEPANTEAFYAVGTKVTLSATADEGYHFVVWSGADAPAGEAAQNPVVTVTMDAQREVRAVFAANVWTFDGSKTLTDGNWTLTVTKSDRELTVTAADAVFAGVPLDFSRPVRDANGTDYTVVSLNGFTKKPITKVVLPAGLRSLKHSVFAECKALKTVEPLLPETLTEIGVRAFAGCTALEGDVVFPAQNVASPYSWTSDSIWGWFNGSKITSCDMSQATMTGISDSSFNNCSALRWVKLPKGLTTVGSSAFNGCTVLETVEPLLPDTVTSFGACPFMNCASLMGDVKLTNASATVTFTHENNKGYGAFQGCKKLASFEMTASIAHNQNGSGVLDQNMFSGCASLGRVVLPANVTKMTQVGIFGGCTSLTNLCLQGTVPEMSTSLFSAVPNGRLRVYVPKTDPAWTEDFCTAYVTPMNSELRADYSAVYPGERSPKGQFTWSKVKMWLCLYNPLGSGLTVIVR